MKKPLPSEKMVLTLAQAFGENAEIPSGKEPVLEYIGTHTHNEISGFLFKNLTTEDPIFIEKAKMFEQDFKNTSLFLFQGYYTDSSVPIITPKK